MAPDLSSARVLVVDDEEDVLVAARLLLKRHFASVQTIPVPSRLPDLARDGAFDVLLLDMNFTTDVDDGAEGLKWLSEVFAACYSLSHFARATWPTATRRTGTVRTANATSTAATPTM
jgi:CheY-like chemotaxis protein